MGILIIIDIIYDNGNNDNNKTSKIIIKRFTNLNLCLSVITVLITFTEYINTCSFNDVTEVSRGHFKFHLQHCADKQLI